MAKELDLGLKTAYDELFMDGNAREESRLPKIYDIPISEIDDFPDHPYQVRLRKLSLCQCRTTDWTSTVMSTIKCSWTRL